jgi:transglutaminase-like putative cysteine protease
MRYRIVHRTVYEYPEPVTVSHHTARLEPRHLASQRIEEFSLAMTPEPAVRKARTDYFGNRVCFFSIQEIHRQLEVTATSLVDLGSGRVPELSFSPAWDTVAKLFRDPVSPDLVDAYQFCFDSPQLAGSAEFADYARASFPAGTPLLSGLKDLNRRIHQDFTYDPVATTVATPLEEVLRTRRGVCQDFAHLAIAALRSLGLPARYVSGYLRTRPPEGAERLRGADASHAWFAAYCPGADWVEFDPTNNLMPGDEHISVGIGRDFSDVSPVSGVVTGGGAHEVHVAVDVDEF